MPMVYVMYIAEPWPMLKGSSKVLPLTHTNLQQRRISVEH
jgi:hypothetical protein